MRIRSAESAASPLLGVRARCTHLQYCRTAIFKAMWHPMINPLEKMQFPLPCITNDAGAQHCHTHLKAFRMLYDRKIAIRRLKSLDTSEFKIYNILWPKNM
jgi:hypothetical protein